MKINVYGRKTIQYKLYIYFFVVSCDSHYLLLLQQKNKQKGGYNNKD